MKSARTNAIITVKEKNEMIGMRYPTAMAAMAIALVLMAWAVPASGAVPDQNGRTAVQAGNSRWAKVIGGSGTDSLLSVIATSDGGYLAGGETDSFGSGGRDLWLIKIDATGNVAWERTYGGTSIELLKTVLQTPDGGYVLGAITSSFGALNQEPWVLKLDASGNIVWQRTYGTAALEWIDSMALSSDGGYVLAGSFGTWPGMDAWVLKLDGSGNPIWQKIYQGSGRQYGYCIQHTSDGGYILGSSTGATGDGSVYEAWLMKLDASGNEVWRRVYGGNGEQGSYVRQTADGGYLLVGMNVLSGMDEEMWVVKTDVFGGVTWQRTFGGVAKDGATSCLQTADGGYLVAGFTASFGAGSTDGWLLKLDSAGNLAWQKTYGGSQADSLKSIASTPDGGAILAGYTQSFGAGGWDAWLIKVSSTGDVDASCGPLVLASSSLSTPATTTPSTSPLTTADTSVLGSLSSAATTTPGAVFVTLCSGGESGPVITSIKSKTSKAGSSATIYGTGFSSDKKKVVVYFGTKKVKSIRKATTTSLKLTIPRVKGTLDVYVVVAGIESNHFSFTVK